MKTKIQKQIEKDKHCLSNVLITKRRRAQFYSPLAFGSTALTCSYKLRVTMHLTTHHTTTNMCVLFYVWAIIFMGIIQNHTKRKLYGQ